MRGALLAFFLLACSFAGFSQRQIDEQSSSTKDRTYFGGGFGLNGGTDSYGNRFFYVGLYPIVGYMVTNQFSVGTGITYQYYNYPDVDRSIHQYGFSPFARYNFGQMFLYAEYQVMNTPTYNNPAARKGYTRMLLGAGYSQPIGQRSSINVMGMYDVIWNKADYAFASPWVIRVFFSF